MVKEQAQNISVIDASIGYTNGKKPTTILAGINLDFYPGDFIGIIGNNGVGKSTLLKSISGLIPLINGRVNINGIPISEIGLEEIARKMALVLTERVGGFNLTVFDMVAMGQMPYTNSFHQINEESNRIILSAIERCGLKSYKKKPLIELSDGLFQKTMIGRALAQQTPNILLDEPTAFLDYASKHELFSFLKGLCGNEQKCVLVSSHDLDLVLKYCTKVLIISENRTEVLPVENAVQSTFLKELTKGY